MRKTTIIALSVALLSVALPASAQNRGDRDRGGESQYRDRDGDRDRDRDRAPVSQSELRAADNRLNQIYERRITEARTADRRDRRSRDWYSQEAALRQAERNWIAYRDADCRYMAQPDAGDRDYRDSLRSCLLLHTSARIEILRGVRMDYSQR